MNTRHRSRSLALIAIVTGSLGWLVWSAPAASASCAFPPAESSDAFVGTVIDTALDGRKATVQMEGGSTVSVLGAAFPREGVMSSVDRTYNVGATYEFHPINDEDPYEDSACTATHRIMGEKIPDSLRGDTVGAEPATSDSADPPQAGLPAASASTGLSGTLAVGVAALVALGLGGALLWLRLARR
jgi:hypothetical protein